MKLTVFEALHTYHESTTITDGLENVNKYVLLLNPKFNPYLLFKFLIFIILVYYYHQGQ